MKKLLLVAILAIGATAFAAQEGTETDVTLPIKVKGEVVANTKTNLVIEPIKNAGVDGRCLEFDFGQVVSGRKQELDGTFKIYRANGAAILDVNTNNTLFVSLDEAEEALSTTTDVLADTSGNKTTISYSINDLNIKSATTASKAEYTGTLKVVVDATGASNSLGTFSDVSKSIFVKVSKAEA